LGITHEAVAASMSQVGISVIQNRCTKIDHQRVMSGA
jgi:predicted CoA-binding protein